MTHHGTQSRGERVASTDRAGSQVVGGNLPISRVKPEIFAGPGDGGGGGGRRPNAGEFISPGGGFISSCPRGGCISKRV